VAGRGDVSRPHENWPQNILVVDNRGCMFVLLIRNDYR